MDATFWTAFGALATAAGAIGAVWTLLEIRKDSRDRTRPMMTAELKAAVLTETAELHISNRGQSVAKNVRVIFDPPLPVLSGENAEKLFTPFLQRRLRVNTVTQTEVDEQHRLWREERATRRAAQASDEGPSESPGPD